MLRDIAVVVVSYRSATHLAQLLPSLPVDRLAGVVVVDNASEDDSVTVAQQVGGVTVIANDANVGFGAACNVGAAAAPPQAHLLFLNPDARITAVDLERLHSTLTTTPDCGLVAPRLFRGDEPLTSSGDEATVRTELRRFAPLFVAARLPERRHSPERAVTGSVAYVEGACMLVRRQAFDAVGGFDPFFFLFFEELDLGHRLRAAGWSVVLEADARAEHAVAASRGSLPDNARAALVDGTVRYFLKWRGRMTARAFVWAATPMWWLRLARGQLTRDEVRGYRKAARAALSR